MKVSEWLYCILTGSRRQLPSKLGHSLLHWQHNVINCTCDKSSISPSLPSTHHWLQPLFLEDYICNLIPLLLHPPQLTLKAIPFAGNVRNWFPSNQYKNILPVCRRLSIKMTTFSLISSYYWHKKYPFFAPSPQSFNPPSPTSNSSNPSLKGR